MAYMEIGEGGQGGKHGRGRVAGGLAPCCQAMGFRLRWQNLEPSVCVQDGLDEEGDTSGRPGRVLWMKISLS